MSQMENIKQPTEQYLNNLSDRVEKLWKMMDETMETSFQLMEMIHQEKLSKTTEQTPKNTEAPKTPPRKNQIYRKEDQDAEGDADSEESEPEIKERKKKKNKEKKRLRVRRIPPTHPYRLPKHERRQGGLQLRQQRQQRRRNKQNGTKNDESSIRS